MTHLVATYLLGDIQFDVPDETALSYALGCWEVGKFGGALKITLTCDGFTWRWSTDRNGMMRAVVAMAGGMR